jgi:hypothetical protein
MNIIKINDSLNDNILSTTNNVYIRNNTLRHNFSGGGYLNNSTSYAATFSLRQLNILSSFAITVRRDSDNDLINIGFDNYGNLDTNKLIDFVGSGNGFIRNWYNQGSSFHLQQPTNSLQPQIVDSGTIFTLNSRPTIKFNGTQFLLINGNYTINSSNLIVYTNPCSQVHFIVFKPDNIKNVIDLPQETLLHIRSSINGDISIGGFGRTYRFSAPGGTRGIRSTTDVFNTNLQLLTSNAVMTNNPHPFGNQTTMSAQINNVNLTTSNLTNGVFISTPFTDGQFSSFKAMGATAVSALDLTNFFTGYISEYFNLTRAPYNVAAYSTQSINTDRTKINSNIMTYYNIT